MIAFICYFFPSVIALWLFESLTKSSLSLKHCIFRFCRNALVINGLCFAAKKFIFKNATSPIYYDNDMTPSVAFNYIIMAVVAAVVITVLEVLISKNVKIAVEGASDEKEKNI